MGYINNKVVEILNIFHPEKHLSDTELLSSAYPLAS